MGREPKLRLRNQGADHVRLPPVSQFYHYAAHAAPRTYHEKILDNLHRPPGATISDLYSISKLNLRSGSLVCPRREKM